MPNNRHLGEQNSREERRSRQVRRTVIKYVILTDGEKTEKNYFEGLQTSLREGTPISLNVLTNIKPKKFIEKCSILKNEDLFPDLNPRKIWVVFDRDRVIDFDAIIQEAEKLGCSVGWSNPCIEEWFWAYFESLASHADSVTANDLFKELFMTKTGRQYTKNLPDLCKILQTYGDEEQAIHRAEEKLTALIHSGSAKPSEMYSATTVFRLVREWRNITYMDSDSDRC